MPGRWQCASLGTKLKGLELGQLHCVWCFKSCGFEGQPGEEPGLAVPAACRRSMGGQEQGRGGGRAGLGEAVQGTAWELRGREWKPRCGLGLPAPCGAAGSSVPSPRPEPWALPSGRAGGLGEPRLRPCPVPAGVRRLHGLHPHAERGRQGQEAHLPVQSVRGRRRVCLLLSLSSCLVGVFCFCSGHLPGFVGSSWQLLWQPGGINAAGFCLGVQVSACRAQRLCLLRGKWSKLQMDRSCWCEGGCRRDLSEPCSQPGFDQWCCEDVVWPPGCGQKAEVCATAALPLASVGPGALALSLGFLTAAQISVHAVAELGKLWTPQGHCRAQGKALVGQGGAGDGSLAEPALPLELEGKGRCPHWCSCLASAMLTTGRRALVVLPRPAGHMVATSFTSCCTLHPPPSALQRGAPWVHFHC